MITDFDFEDSSYYTKIIGSNIRYERKKRNLTIEDLAEIIGMAPGFLGLIERGQRGTSVKNLVKITEIFGLTLDQLITVDMQAYELGSNEPLKLNEGYTKKVSTIINFIKAMNEPEIDYFISSIKSYHKLIRTLYVADDKDEF